MAGAQQVGSGSGGMMGQQQRAPYEEIGMARQQNLLKIQQLRQTLEAAQQQEAQYKSQLEVNVSNLKFFLLIVFSCHQSEHLYILFLNFRFSKP